MIRTPINTSICLTSTGTYCISAGGISELTYLIDSNTTQVLGIGSSFSPYKVEVKLDTTSDNAIQVTGLGLYVSSEELGFDVSFINEL